MPPTHGGPRNSSAPGVKSARRKLAASAVCECPKAWCSAKALNRRATANRSPNPIAAAMARWRDGAMAMAMTRGKLFTESNGGLGMVARMAMQVGGHSGMLTIGRYCLKPVQSGNRGIREVTFYEQCLHRGDGVEQLQPFLCDYHGVIVLGTNACEQHYLVLDDCTNDMARPCALDIKLGTRTTEPNASLKKQRKQLAKYPPQTELGCRLVGMRV